MLQTHSLIRLSDLVNYSSFTQFCQLFDYQVLGLDYYTSHSKTAKSPEYRFQSSAAKIHTSTTRVTESTHFVALPYCEVRRETEFCEMLLLDVT
jgi:hypothetical protein